MVESYFFDTYALLELLQANPNYEEFQKVGVATTKLNLMEVYYILLKTRDENYAELVYTRFLPYCVEITDAMVKSAMKLKLQQKRNFSYVDCVGYTTAKVMGLLFLTGDKEFQDLENVKFVQ